MESPSEHFAFSDQYFDSEFLGHYAKLSSTHWTPVEVIQLASKWLAARSDTKILDVGSGVGKFCIVGAQYTGSQFYGVEQREHLVSVSNRILKKFNLHNIQFIHGNFEDVNFNDFDAFYLFNPFWENISTDVLIDKKVTVSSEIYNQYNASLARKLNELKVGTRVASYLMRQSEIPDSYVIEDSKMAGKLIFWVKKH